MAKVSVNLIDLMGTDLSIVNAARVSFSKESEYERCCNGGSYYEPQCRDCTRAEIGDKDTKLIQYLAKHNHWSPFAHAFLSFRIKAPIFVARQLVKHQVGLAWNEVSRRYVDDEPEFYVPETWRKRADNVKQGSSDEAIDLSQCEGLDRKNMEDQLRYLINDAQAVYRRLLDLGVAPEQARMVLPLSTMTEWIWSGSLMAFVRVCKLRLDPHAQKECRDVAEIIAEYLKQEFPVSYGALMDVT